MASPGEPSPRGHLTTDAGRRGDASRSSGRSRTVDAIGAVVDDRTSACQSAGVTVAVPDPAELLHRLVRRRPADGPVTHVEQVPARAGCTGAVAGLGAGRRCAPRSPARGVAAPWQHQVDGRRRWPAPARHVVLATGTASGKSWPTSCRRWPGC